MKTASSATGWSLPNGTGADLDMEGVMITNRTDRITFPISQLYAQGRGTGDCVCHGDSYQLDPSKPFHGKFKISSAGIISTSMIPTCTSSTSWPRR